MALSVAKRSLTVKDADATGKKSARSNSRSGKKNAAKNARIDKKPEKKSPAAKKTTKTNKTATQKSAAKKRASTKTATATKKTTTKKNTTATKPKSKTPATTKAAKTTKPATKAAKTATKTKATKTSKAGKAASAKAKAATKTSKRSTKQRSPIAATKKSAATKAAEKDLRTNAPKHPDDAPLSVVRRDPLGHLVLEQVLRSAGYRGGVSTDPALLETYSTDESIFSIKPQVVLQPRDAEDVAIATSVVAAENKRFQSLSLTPRAAGTGLTGGSLTDSVVLDMHESLTNIGELAYQSGEAFLSCDAGVLWRDMEARLRSAGYYVPAYSTAREICTVGGAVGNNAAGPESLTHGHCVDWVTSMEVVFHDGSTHTVAPLTYKQFKTLSKKKHAYARVAREVFALLEKNAREIKKSRPQTAHNTAGYNIWDVLPQGIAAFKKGTGTFNLIPLLAGSQGTIAVVTNITFRAIPLPRRTTMITVPVYDLAELPQIIKAANAHAPLTFEAFDDKTFDLALQHPEYFKKRLHGLAYYRTMLTMYTTYHVRYKRQLPELILLLSFSDETTATTSAHELAHSISAPRSQARVITSPIEEDMYQLLRHSSYSLSKLQDITKRPAAFLEDMEVPPAKLPAFLTQVKRLCKEFNIQATMHGHAGTGQFHFYPLLDFTNKTTPALVQKMSDAFFDLAIKHGGTISGQHNDGIIRTPYVEKAFGKKIAQVFRDIEQIFDPEDIFNPGKKVNPRFDVREVIRTRN